MKIYTDILNAKIQDRMVSALLDCSGYTGATTTQAVGPSSQEILKTIQELQDELYQPPTIKVPRGDLCPMWNRSEYPTIIYSELLNDEDCYILAGTGVVCGKSAYDKIWEYGYIAVWTGDEPEFKFSFEWKD